MPESTRSTQADKHPEAILAPFAEEPESAAILLDLDGTLAPIVERPEDVAITEDVRDAIRKLAARYGLIAVVTGRRAADARAIVGLPDVTYAGIHGFELLPAAAAAPEAAPALAGHSDDARAFVGRAGPRRLLDAGVRREDKGPIVAFHWRGAASPERAEAAVEDLARHAEDDGLTVHRGRMVLELRPAVAIDKGVAVGALLDGAPAELTAALYAGDDRTDLDAFAELARRRSDGRLERIVRVGVRSEEGPGEIAEEADIVVDGTEDVAGLLGVLAR